MRTSLLFLLAITFLLVSPGLASAQPSRYAAPPPPVAPAPTAAPSDSKLSVGVELIGGDLLFADNPANDAEVSGLGLFLRYRLTRKWHVELSFDKVEAVMQGERVRELRPVNLSLLWYLMDRGQLQGYVRAGMGKADETYTTLDTSAEFENKTGHLGAGLEYRLRNSKLGLMGELRASSVARVLADETTAQASGTEVRLGAAYHF